MQVKQYNLKKYLQSEAAVGVILGLATLLAIVGKNSWLAPWYDNFLQLHFSMNYAHWSVDLSLLHFVNDGLMTLFFFLVGLELKRELLAGQLATKSARILPVVTALGGLTLPALIYAGFNYQDPAALHGWAIPTATDIAFVMGIVAFLGNKIPKSLKVCLLTLAIVDDLLAVCIIGLFYSDNLSVIWLAALIAPLAGLWLLNAYNVKKARWYLLVGAVLWLMVVKSGLHATIAGVILALFIPLRMPNNEINKSSLLAYLEKRLHPWVAYFILPLFALVNAGLDLHALSWSQLAHPITLGTGLGLFIGKQTGVMLSAYLGVKLRWLHLPAGVNWRQFYGMAVLTGFGFTMSLFISLLAFDSVALQELARLGIILGSLLSAVVGYMLFLF